MRVFFVTRWFIVREILETGGTNVTDEMTTHDIV